MNICVKDENVIKIVLKYFFRVYKIIEDFGRYILVDCVYRFYMVVGFCYNRVVEC